MDLSNLVLSDGCEVSASGRIVAYEGEVWFGPALPVRLVRYKPGHEPPPRPSKIGVLVEGADLSRLDERWEKDGGIEGWATLTGTWRGDRLLVTDQGARGGSHREENPKWDVPPCDPPPGGWPRSGRDENISHLVDLESDEVVTVTTFRPSDEQAVLVIASTMPEVTRERLAESVGERLCVIQSRWTRAEVDEIQQRLRTESDWTYFMGGAAAGEDGQLQITAHVVRVVDSLANFAATVPDGLLQVSAWLTPAGS